MTIGSLINPGTPTVAIAIAMIAFCLVQIGIKVAAAHKVDRPGNTATTEELKHRNAAAFWLVPMVFYIVVVVTTLAFDKVPGDPPKFGLNAALGATCAAIALACLVYTWARILWGRHNYKWALIAGMTSAAAAHTTMAFELWTFADTAHNYPLVDSITQFYAWTFGAAALLAVLALVLALVAKLGGKDA